MDTSQTQFHPDTSNPPAGRGTLARGTSRGLRVISAYVAIQGRRAGGETPHNMKHGKRKDPHGKGGHLPLDP
jgi:hypothetical protein